MRHVIEKSWEYNRPLYIAFIDLEKAFDSIPRNWLWRCLGEVYRLDGRLGAAIKSTYEPCMSNVRTGYENERWFRVTTGVKQGSVLSPLLFIAYMDKVIKDFKDQINISGDTMIFADDIAFWTYDQDELEGALMCLNDCLTEAGLKMNKEKTEILTIAKYPPAAMDITIGDTVIRDTDTFKYLGCIFTDKGYKNREEITERIKKYNKCSGALYPLMRDAYVPKEVKKLYSKDC